MTVDLVSLNTVIMTVQLMLLNVIIMTIALVLLNIIVELYNYDSCISIIEHCDYYN